MCAEAMAEASRRQIENETAVAMSSVVDVISSSAADSMESSVAVTATAAAAAAAADVMESAAGPVPVIPVPGGPMMPPNMMPHPHMIPGTTNTICYQPFCMPT